MQLKKGDYVRNLGAPGQVIRVGNGTWLGRKGWADIRWYPGHPDGWSKRMPRSSLERLGGSDEVTIVYTYNGSGKVYVPVSTSKR